MWTLFFRFSFLLPVLKYCYPFSVSGPGLFRIGRCLHTMLELGGNAKWICGRKNRSYTTRRWLSGYLWVYSSSLHYSLQELLLAIVLRYERIWLRWTASERSVFSLPGKTSVQYEQPTCLLMLSQPMASWLLICAYADLCKVIIADMATTLSSEFECTLQICHRWFIFPMVIALQMQDKIPEYLPPVTILMKNGYDKFTPFLFSSFQELF